MNTQNSLDNLIAVEKAARDFGFDWPDTEMILNQVVSECQEVREALLNKEPDYRIQEEIGDLLHTAISLCLFAGYNVDQTLKK
jgi:uncharacterized protein YabN with tetrapyrrole methylase and pyrophosphatase domain